MATGGLVTRIARLLRREGVAGFLGRGLRALGYFRLVWLVRDLESPCGREEDGSTPAAPVRIRSLGPGDFPGYATLRPGARHADFMNRVETGDRCFAAFVSGEMASVTWVTRAQMPVVRRSVRLAADEIGTYRSYTTPARRGSRLQAALMCHIIEEHRGTGVRRVVVLIESHNRSSLRSRMRSGFDRRGMVHVLRLGNRQKHWIRVPGLPRNHTRR